MNVRSLAVACSALVALACGSRKSELPSPSVNIRVQAATATTTLSRVEIEIQPANIVSNLTLNTDGSFGGAISVPAGTHSFTARAYTGTPPYEVLVGTGTTEATITAGNSTLVVIKILDDTGPLPGGDHGPIITSLAISDLGPFVAEAITLTAAAVDPDADAVTFSWTQSEGCSGTFSSPASATTQWSATTAGACTLTLTVSSRSLTDTISLVIVVSDLGTANISGYFVPNPSFVNVAVANRRNPNPSNVCNVRRVGANWSCEIDWPTGQDLQIEYLAHVGTQPSDPDASLSIDCGGTETSQAAPQTELLPTAPDGHYWRLFYWTAPSSPTVCMLTARLVNEGLTDTMTVAVNIVEPICRDDMRETDNTLANAAWGYTPVPTAPTTTIEAVPNDEDWMYVIGTHMDFTGLTVVSSNAGLSVELWAMNAGSGEERIAFGTGRAEVSGRAPGTNYWVRVVPDPAATGCALPYYLTLTAVP
ncbi:PKD domain containing protein [Anaeromyxobacter sp. Fw109-5]|nr:PKD domain containing protein [Anaeromyxobacter sp. Fw109-5]